MHAVYAEEWGCFPILHCKKHWWQWGVSLAPSFTRRGSTFDRPENTRAGELWPSVLSTAKAEAVCLTPLQTHCSQPRSFLLITILSGFPKRLLSFPHPVLSMLGRYLSAETGNKIESEESPLPWVLLNRGSLLTEDHRRDLFPKCWGCHGCPAYQWPQQGTKNELPHQKSDRFRRLPIHSPRCRKTGPLCPQLSQQLRRAMQEGQHSLLRTRDSPQPWHSLS